MEYVLLFVVFLLFFIGLLVLIVIADSDLLLPLGLVLVIVAGAFFCKLYSKITVEETMCDYLNNKIKVETVSTLPNGKILKVKLKYK